MQEGQAALERTYQRLLRAGAPKAAAQVNALLNELLGQMCERETDFTDVITVGERECYPRDWEIPTNLRNKMHAVADSLRRQGFESSGAAIDPITDTKVSEEIKSSIGAVGKVAASGFLAIALGAVLFYALK